MIICLPLSKTLRANTTTLVPGGISLSFVIKILHANGLKLDL